MNYKEKWKKSRLGSWRDWDAIGGAERNAWRRVQSGRHKILLVVDLALVAAIVYFSWGTAWDDLALTAFLTFVITYFFGWLLFIPDSPPGVDAGY